MQRLLKYLAAVLLVPAMFVAVNTVDTQKAEAQWRSYGWRHGSYYRPYHYGYRSYYRPYYRSYGYRNYYRPYYGSRYYYRSWPRYGVSTPFGSFYWR